jgi:hypothetical protein
VYSVLLSATGNYGIGFIVCAAPALIVGTLLVRAPARG